MPASASTSTSSIVTTRRTACRSSSRTSLRRAPSWAGSAMPSTKTSRSKSKPASAARARSSRPRAAAADGEIGVETPLGAHRRALHADRRAAPTSWARPAMSAPRSRANISASDYRRPRPQRRRPSASAAACAAARCDYRMEYSVHVRRRLRRWRRARHVRLQPLLELGAAVRGRSPVSHRAHHFGSSSPATSCDASSR